MPKVNPAPANVRVLAEVVVIAIAPELPLNVRPLVAMFQTVVAAVEVSDQVPDPRVRPLVVEAEDWSVKQVTLKPPPSSVPLLTVKFCVVVRSSAKVYVPDGATTKTWPPYDFPAEVRVNVLRPPSVRLPDPEIVIPLMSVIEPNIIVLIPNANAGVPVAPTKLILVPKRGISMVTVWLALKAALIITLSCGSGTRVVQALALQLALVVPLHV